jgi:hypothetical protein
MAVLRRFETVEWQIEFAGNGVKRGWIKPGSLIVEVHYHAGVDAGNTVKVKHCELINFNALQGSTLNHQNTSPKILIKTSEAVTGLRLTPVELH